MAAQFVVANRTERVRDGAVAHISARIGFTQPRA
jgi:hypothetical protein